MKKFYYIISVLMLLATACQQEDVCSPEDNVPVNVVYQVQMGDDLQSRAIGDGSEVDELVVGIFRDGEFVNKLTFKDEADGTKDRIFENITIPMMMKETYDLVFWAQKSENGIYTIEDGLNVKIDYLKYTQFSVANNFDAFTGKQDNVSVYNPGNKNITLKRPFAQLNVLASHTSNIGTVEFTIDKVYTSYNLYTGEATEGVQTFTIFPNGNETERVNATTYHYLASVFLLAPETVSLIGGIYNGNNEEIKDLNVQGLTLQANNRTNLLYNLNNN